MADGNPVLQQTLMTLDANFTNEEQFGMNTEPDVSGTTRITEPSNNDWQRLKPIIKELYRNQKRSLEEVANIIEREHGFKATYVTWP